MLGLDRRAARYAWTVVFIFLLLELVYLIRETLFIFAVALLFAHLLWPLTHSCFPIVILELAARQLHPAFVSALNT